MIYTVTDINYDTNGAKVELPETLTIDVPDDLDPEEAVDFISDEISNQTGYCHFGFSTTPVIHID